MFMKIHDSKNRTWDQKAFKPHMEYPLNVHSQTGQIIINIHYSISYFQANPSQSPFCARCDSDVNTILGGQEGTFEGWDHHSTLVMNADDVVSKYVRQQNPIESN